MYLYCVCFSHSVDHQVEKYPTMKGKFLYHPLASSAASSMCSYALVADDDNLEPGIEQVQALTDILHSALCCHNNETCAPIANLPSSA